MQETRAEIAIGTGFFYVYDSQYYLITNGHCITGSNATTKRRLSKKYAGFPDLLRTNLKVAEQDPPAVDLAAERMQIVLYSVDIKLYNDEYYTKPTWYIHPKYGYDVDVVAIPVDIADNLKGVLNLVSINRYLTHDKKPRAAEDAYILGYPYGITDEFEFPIWKKASIASEPNVDYQGLPRMLVDTASRSGMSGSPVIKMKPGLVAPGKNTEYWDEPYGNAGSLVNMVAGFLGIYSGHLGGENDAQLGVVWRKEVIEEILAAKVSGTTEFQSWPCSE